MQIPGCVIKKQVKDKKADDNNFVFSELLALQYLAASYTTAILLLDSYQFHGASRAILSHSDAFIS